MKFPAVEGLLREFASVLQNQTGCTISVDAKERGREIDVWLNAEVTLRATKALKVSMVALEHAKDREAYLRAFIDEHLRPLEDQLQRANRAATTSWRAVLPG